MTDMDERMTIRQADQPGDLGWVVKAHGELYAAEFGWDKTFEELVAGVVGTFATARDPARERAWIAEVEGDRAGCVVCMCGDEPAAAQLRILLVSPRHRGVGIGASLVAQCVEFARTAGYDQMTLWTNEVLTSARRIYQASGFELVAEQPHHSFGHDLVGQTWTRRLT